MKLSVVIPVGPGHVELVTEAWQSVKAAYTAYPGPFTELELIPISDLRGELGRSVARNCGIKAATGDWLFILDADDLITENAIWLAESYFSSYDAVFGTVASEVIGTEELKEHTSGFLTEWEPLCLNKFSTLCVGFFIRSPVAKNHLFHPLLDVGEDHEYFISLFTNHSFIRLPSPLIRIRYHVGSAMGPKGLTSGDKSGSRARFPKETLAELESLCLFWRNRGKIPISAEQRTQKYWKEPVS